MPTLCQIDGWDPVANAAVTLTAASHDDPALCMTNGQTWWPALAKLPVLAYDLFDGAFGTAIEAPSSTLTLRSEPWPNFGRYMLANARLRLWTGKSGDTWANWTLRFDGRVTNQPTLKDDSAEVAFAVDDRWLDTALLATYAGTTGIEGPAALKGQAKPLALGAPRYVAGVLIDSVNSVFQISGYGAVQSIDAALEKLARFGAAIGDFATYAALVAATIPAGAWATCNAAGLARFGAPPNGQISFLVSGDSGGPEGWVRTPGKLIRRLALLSGGAGRINDASLNALDAARPYPCSLNLTEQTTAREVIQKLAASVNAVAGVSWTGQMFVAPVAIGAPTATLAADGSALPPVGSVGQIEQAAPWQKLALTAERAWTVHQLADIAFTATLVDLGGYAAGTTYREGNIVELPSGARYMYSAITPTAGNAPPNAAYWTQLASAAPTDFANVTGVTKPSDYATTTFNQSTPPTAAESREDDAWQDTGSGNMPYRRLFGSGRLAFVGNTLRIGGVAVVLRPWALARDDGKTSTFRQDGLPIASAVGDTWYQPSTGQERRWSGANWEITTDTTALAQVTVDLPAQAVVGCDSLGKPLMLELPRIVGMKVARGGVSITADASVTYAATFTNLTGTMGDGTGGSTKGTAIVTAMSANEGYLDVLVTVAGIAQQPKRCVFTKQLAQAAQAGGSGAKRATDTTLNSINANAFVQVSDTLTVTLAASEQLYGAGAPDYYVTGTRIVRAVSAYWAYRVANSGGAFTAFGPAITGSTAQSGYYQSQDLAYNADGPRTQRGANEYVDPVPGNVDTAQSIGGLAAGDYEIALFASANADGATVTWDTNGGAVQVEAKP